MQEQMDARYSLDLPSLLPDPLATDKKPLSETYQALELIDPVAKKLFLELLPTRAFRLRKKGAKSSLIKLLNREIPGKEKHPVEESLGLSLMGTAGWFFEHLAYLCLRSTLPREGEILISPVITESLFNHPTLVHILNEAKAERSVPDNLLIKPNGKSTAVIGVVESTLQRYWEGSMEAHKKKQMEDYLSGDAIRKFLLEDHPVWPNELRQTFQHYFPHYPARLVLEDQNPQVVVAFPKACEGGPEELPIDKNESKACIIPVTASSIIEVSKAFYRDLFYEIFIEDPKKEVRKTSTKRKSEHTFSGYAFLTLAPEGVSSISKPNFLT
jgi:hypothetical protein